MSWKSIEKIESQQCYSESESFRGLQFELWSEIESSQQDAWQKTVAIEIPASK